MIHDGNCTDGWEAKACEVQCQMLDRATGAQNKQLRITSLEPFSYLPREQTKSNRADVDGHTVGLT